LDFTGYGHFFTLWAAKQSHLKFVKVYGQIFRRSSQHVGVSSGCGHLERFGSLGLIMNVDHLSWLHAEGRTVNALAIDKDVSVNYHLTGLCDGARHSRAKN
jgi:hypothetical protein